MAAYAAVISLEHTLNQLLDSSPEEKVFLYKKNIQGYLLTSTNSHISVVPSSQNVIRSALSELASVRDHLEKLYGCNRVGRRVVEALEGQIGDVVYKLEDVVEFHIHSKAISVEEVRVEIESLIEELKMTKELYIKELDNPSFEDLDDDAAADGKIRSNNIFGLDDDNIECIIEQLTSKKTYELCVGAVVGVEGSDRTYLVKRAFELKRNDKASNDDTLATAWVSVGPKYEVKDIINSLLSQLDPHHHADADNDKEDLREQLYDKLKGRRYLIVLDSVCDTLVWDSVRSSFPAENLSSRVLITTSLEEIAEAANSCNTYRVRILDDDESWDIIRELVFNKGEPCPPELEEAGKRIAHNCQGRRLQIIKAAFFLLKADKQQEKWNNIATDLKENYYEMIPEISPITPHLLVENSISSRPYSIEEIEETFQAQEAFFHWFAFDLCRKSQSDTMMISLYGMAGIGKTTLARKLFEDPSILRCYDHRVWVTLGPKYRVDNLVVDILAQIDPNIDKIEDDILFEQFSTMLFGKRCLFVLDNVWDKKTLSFMEDLFKYTKFEVLFTSRLVEIGRHGAAYNMSLLNEEQSWCLLCESVFVEMSCPPELEKPGRMIAKECEGLPLLIVTVAGLLSQAEKTRSFWYEVARKKNSIFKDAHDKIYNTLLPSYEYLHQHLKPCFLYMAVFPQKYEISTLKLLELFSSERILESNFLICLDDLDSNSLLLTRKNHLWRIKTCHLHSVFWHMCVRKARETKFFHVLNKTDDAQGINGQRRLCIHNNMLFGIKDVCALLVSNLVVRSLLCTGPYQQYPVSVCVSFTLLKIMDALAIRFYLFPVGVLELVQMKYLALTCNGKLPASISRLWNLQYLIIKEHHNIRSMSGASLPVQIWDMKQLKHLQVMGGDLPDPCGAVLPNLVILLDVTPRSCTKGVLRGTPNLLKLGIRIELTLDTPESSFCFDHISHLSRLISLKCVVMNPAFMRSAPPIPPMMFPSSLKKLSLSGLGYPWEYMSEIGKLDNLEVLKLRCYAFRGPQWVIHDGDFLKLKYLLIEDTDLVYWRANVGFRLRVLRYLTIRHCYKLREIVYPMNGKYRRVELTDCDPSLQN